MVSSIPNLRQRHGQPGARLSGEVLLAGWGRLPRPPGLRYRMLQVGIAVPADRIMLFRRAGNVRIEAWLSSETAAFVVPAISFGFAVVGSRFDAGAAAGKIVDGAEIGVNQGELVGDHLKSENVPLFRGSGSASIGQVGLAGFVGSRRKGAEVGGVFGGLAGHGVAPQERELPNSQSHIARSWGAILPTWGG